MRYNVGGPVLSACVNISPYSRFCDVLDRTRVDGRIATVYRRMKRSRSDSRAKLEYYDRLLSKTILKYQVKGQGR